MQKCKESNVTIASGPNPWKVVVIMEELSIPYKIVSLKFDDVKKKPYTDINPNGRFPGISRPQLGHYLIKITTCAILDLISRLRKSNWGYEC